MSFLLKCKKTLQSYRGGRNARYLIEFTDKTQVNYDFELFPKKCDQKPPFRRFSSTYFARCELTSLKRNAILFHKNERNITKIKGINTHIKLNIERGEYA